MESTNTQKLSPTKKVVFWIILLLLVFAVTCLLPELILRLADPRGRAELVMALGIERQSNYVDDPVLGHKHRDPLYFWDDKEHPPSEEKPPGTMRVFAMGDSFVKAHTKVGVELKDSFYRVAARLLSERPDAPPYEWFHFGVSGYCERQHLALLRQYGPLYRPDVIVVQVYLGNDVGENSGIIVQQLQVRDESLRIWNFYRVPTQETTSTSPIEALAERSYFAHFLVERLTILGWKLISPQYSIIPGSTTMNHILDLMHRPPSPYIEDAWQVTEDLVVQIKQESEALDAQLMFVLVPKEVQVNKEVSDEVMTGFNLDPAEYDFDQPNRRFGDILARHGIEYIDMTPLFRQKIANGEVLYEGHFNTEGHRVVGQAISEALVERGFVP